VLFPPELVPGVGHSLVDKLGNHATRRLTMRKLESYNAFTEKLEYKAVMAASIKIAQNPQAFGLSEQAGREARLIITDESHHAYVAIELIRRIPGFSELPPLTPSQPPFLSGLDELERGLPTEFADDLLVAFVSISESLITSILRGIPRDQRVVSAVRNTVRDHCIDEARHHSYFVYVVHQHCASSTPDRRELLRPLYAKLIRLFSGSGHRSMPGLSSGSRARPPRCGGGPAGPLFARAGIGQHPRRLFPDPQTHRAGRGPGSSGGGHCIRGTEADRLAGWFGAGGWLGSTAQWFGKKVAETIAAFSEHSRGLR
jgi:hypothetical protein